MNKEKPLVSILIPSYNAEKWISATIKSAIAQTWSNKEIIVVDDGSTDNTLKIAKGFQSKHVKVITQKNSGACVARNKALVNAQGDFIQWLDSDDILAPDKIEIQLSASDLDPQSKVLHSSAWAPFYFRLSKAKFIPDPLWQDLSPAEWLIKHIGDAYYMYPAAWLVSRKLTELAGPWNEKLLLNQDGEYFCRVIASSESVQFHPKAKSYYRKGNLSSVSSFRSRKKLESLNQARNLCVKVLLKLENTELTRNACTKYLKKMNYVLLLNDKCSPLISENEKKILELGGKIEPPLLSAKFKLVEKFIGFRAASLIKTKLWHSEILLRKYWDKFLYVLFGDVI
jgi:glycosyltransferase involved in cell wall biosynthesis